LTVKLQTRDMLYTDEDAGTVVDTRCWGLCGLWEKCLYTAMASAVTVGYRRHVGAWWRSSFCAHSHRWH